MIEVNLFYPDAVETELLELGPSPSDGPPIAVRAYAAWSDLGGQRLENVDGEIVDECAFAKQHGAVRELR